MSDDRVPGEPEGITALREELQLASMKDKFWLSRDEAQYLLDRAATPRHESLDKQVINDAAMWSLCTSRHDLGNGEVVECHVNVGVNYWRDGAWLDFYEVDPRDLTALLESARAKAKP